jgi:hypothetical protein
MSTTKKKRAPATRSLAQLAREIIKEHNVAVAQMRTSLRHARHAGELLFQVKDRLKHGEFMRWTETHCKFSHDTANLYMKIAREWATLVNSQSIENLTLPQAANLLASCGVSEEKDEQFTQDRDRLFVLGILTPADLEGLTPQQAKMFVTEVQQANADLGWEYWKARIEKAKESPDASEAPQLQAQMDKIPRLVDHRRLALYARDAATKLREGKIGGRAAIRKHVRVDERNGGSGKMIPLSKGVGTAGSGQTRIVTSTDDTHLTARIAAPDGLEVIQVPPVRTLDRYENVSDRFIDMTTGETWKVLEYEEKDREVLAGVCLKVRPAIDTLEKTLTEAQADRNRRVLQDTLTTEPVVVAGS